MRSMSLRTETLGKDKLDGARENAYKRAWIDTVDQRIADALGACARDARNREISRSPSSAANYEKRSAWRIFAPRPRSCP